MTDNWKEITDPEELFKLKKEGWEIEFANSSSQVFAKWSGLAWHADRQFRARSRQPKMKKVNQLAFFAPSGIRYDMLENSEQHRQIMNYEGWIRVPAEDKEIEVPE